jgi:hypothetical protein
VDALLGVVADEKFAQLVALGKMITDYAPSEAVSEAEMPRYSCVQCIVAMCQCSSSGATPLGTALSGRDFVAETEQHVLLPSQHPPLVSLARQSHQLLPGASLQAVAAGDGDGALDEEIGA